MFFFFHLATGIILGLLIAEVLRDRRWIVPCVIGAVLPDIFDKPLNFILIPTLNGNGRFLFHNFIVFLILLAAGLLFWKYYRSPVVVALDIGILSHQILDSMWAEPKFWLYPLLGPYPAHPAYSPDFIFDLLGTDIYNPSEWIFIVLCTCALLLYWQRGRLAAAATRHKKAAGTLLKSAEAVLWVLCGMVIACGLLKIPLEDLAISNPDQYAFTAVILALAVLLLMRWETALRHARPVPKNLQERHGRRVPAPPVTVIDRMACLVRLAGRDPDLISLTAAREIVSANVVPGDPMNRSIHQMTLLIVTAVVAITAAGGIVLLAGGRGIPAGMLATGAVAAGLLAGLLVTSVKTGPVPLVADQDSRDRAPAGSCYPDDGPERGIHDDTGDIHGISGPSAR
jgi:inner membrane protein